ncbi:hypothetical protein MSAN_02183000 [Mycena sanguinolenta]|uniref:Uncharacterized protein n=1 Tax=Mycena sanguinolenta TaxID=230812 RepID=A0A8H6XFY8_9AGAR|nr:hypothetical protein MSAN_02183000 [Mycena sanguinolenta]
MPAHTTLIIAVVAGAVGGLLFLLLLVCLCRRPEKKVPLPPKQELARYREQQIIQAESRPKTWYESELLSAPSGTFSGSKSSLLPPSRTGSPFPRRPSLNISEAPSEDVSDASLVHHGLEQPHLAFDTSSTSLSTAETDSPKSSSPLSDPSYTPRQSSFSSRPNHRARPLSTGSNTSSPRRGRDSVRNSTTRGVPHRPHSGVQIVLPAPLAFSNDRTSVHENSPRFSMVDQWAPAAVRSEGNPIPRTQQRSFSGRKPSPNLSFIRSTLAQPPINAREGRRPTTVSETSHIPQFPPAARHQREYSAPASAPPVPQIPQQWLGPPSGNPPSLMGIEHPGRGRPTAASSATTLLPAPEPDDRPPPADAERKLQKRSRSSGH